MTWWTGARMQQTQMPSYKKVYMNIEKVKHKKVALWQNLYCNLNVLFIVW
jgi:hypothetical protein